MAPVSSPIARALAVVASPFRAASRAGASTFARFRRHVAAPSTPGEVELDTGPLDADFQPSPIRGPQPVRSPRPRRKSRKSLSFGDDVANPAGSDEAGGGAVEPLECAVAPAKEVRSMGAPPQRQKHQKQIVMLAPSLLSASNEEDVLKCKADTRRELEPHLQDIPGGVLFVTTDQACPRRALRKEMLELNT